MKRLLVLAIILAPASYEALRHMAWMGRPAAPTPVVALSTERSSLLVEPVVKTIKGEQMATRERAVADAQRKLRYEVLHWVHHAGVPLEWKVPNRILKQMVREGKTEDVDRGYAIMHRQVLSADFSPAMRQRVVDAYEREIGAQRLGILGVVLLFLLACLAAVSGYIRADEATKGYYTNHLRLAAAAGIGAAGVVVYRLLT
jgi:hypothetical protein